MSKPVLLSIGNGKVQELVGTANNDVLTWDSTLDGGSWKSAAGGGGGGSGTVTSVGLTGGTSGIVIGGTASPITTSGTFDLDAPLRFAFNTATPTAVAAAGQVAWNDTEGSLESMLKGDVVVANLGQQIYQRVVNAEASPITKGQIVYVFGSSGTRVSVKLALADADLTSAGILGVVAETIAASGTGFVMTSGLMKGLSVLPSTTFADGEVVYLSPTTAGALTNVKPTAPNHLVTVGYVAKTSNGSAGELLVHPQNGYELGELHDVYINSPTSGQILIYDATAGQTRWENASLTGGTGVTVTPGPGSLSVAIGQAVGTTSSVQFGSLALTTALPVTSGGTGLSSISSGQILYASGANTLAAGTLSSLSWSSVTPTSTISISPAGLSGTGTGLATTVTGGFRSDGTGGGLTLRGGNVTTGTGGATTITAGAAVTGTGGAVSVIGGSGSVANGAVNIGTTTTSAVTIGATGITTTVNGTVSLANALSVGSGGTGATTLTGYVMGNGASAMTASATVPTSDLSGTVSLTSQVSGTLPVANGGTNNASLSVTQGTVYYGDGTKLVGLAPGTSGHFLKTNGAGADPEWAAAGGGGSTPYDLSGEFVGTPTSSAVIMRFVAARAFTFGGTAQFACVTGPTSTATFTVNVNGTSKGTVTIATSGTSGSGTITSTSIVTGDLITVVATTPAAITSPYWTLPGTV